MNGNTGIVLTIDGSTYASDDKQVYIVFENLTKAKEYIVERQLVDDETDYSIFDDKQELIEFVKAAKWRT